MLRIFYFGFTSDGICGAFRIFGRASKKKIIAGGLSPCLLTCLLLYLVLCSSFVHTQDSGVD